MQIFLNEEDFTITHYRKLCQIAYSNWPFSMYANIPWGERFILWRHDLDISINRSRTLAKIEHEQGIRATYFLNPHCEFYNIAEFSQYQIIKEIIGLGHDIGLHFDSAFYGSINENELDVLVSREASYLEDLFGIRPQAFSFHNPTAHHLYFEADYYGGLVNCYSKRFKTEVAYCSDSNGYWRFRRLHDVLLEANVKCLQVLTHPGWWQEKSMPPRRRIFRSVYGRAVATLRNYDQGLKEHGRLNHAGASVSLEVLRNTFPEKFELCDYLWNQEEFQTLFIELWRLFEGQVNHLCMVQLSNEWNIPVDKVNILIDEADFHIEGWKLFHYLFNEEWVQATGKSDQDYIDWYKIRNKLLNNRNSVTLVNLEKGCIYMCGVIQRIAEWEKSRSWSDEGMRVDASVDHVYTERLDDLVQHHSELIQQRLQKMKQDFGLG